MAEKKEEPKKTPCVVDCGSGYNPCPEDCTRCCPSGKQKNINYQEIAAGFAAKYMRNSLNQVLANNGVVANVAAASSLSRKQIAQLLYNYYLSNGAAQYGSLLKQITPPSSSTLSASDASVIAAAVPGLNQIAAVRGNVVTNADSMALGTNSNEKINLDWAKGFWDAVVGGSTSTTEPVVTTITKTNVVAVIGIIAVVGILAYVIVKSN